MTGMGLAYIRERVRVRCGMGVSMGMHSRLGCMCGIWSMRIRSPTGGRWRRGRWCWFVRRAAPRALFGLQADGGIEPGGAPGVVAHGSEGYEQNGEPGEGKGPDGQRDPIGKVVQPIGGGDPGHGCSNSKCKDD